MQLLLFGTSSSSCSLITLLYIFCASQLQISVTQRNPPQSSSGNSNLYVYGRGDIPIFNPLDPHGALLASLRELIIAIR